MPWLVQPFQSRAGHHTHLHRMYNGIHYCVRCGAWAELNFKRVLSKPRKARQGLAGAAALAAVSRGTLPQGLTEWPEDRDLLEFI
eukprot:11488353-Heterocapsa_arctica.AAC.1